MKKITLQILFTFCFALANAQFEKGSKWVAGEAGFDYYKLKGVDNNTKDNKGLIVYVSPSFIKFKDEKSYNSFYFTYMNYFYKQQYSQTSFDNRYSRLYRIGVQQNHIYPLIDKRLYSNISTSFYGGLRYYKAENGSTSTSLRYEAGTGINIGIVYHLNNRFALTTAFNDLFYLNASYLRTKDSNANTTDVAKGFEVYGGCGLAGSSLGYLQFGLMYKLKK